MKHRLFLVAVLTALAVSCVRDKKEEDSARTWEMTFTASMAENQVKTTIRNGINVFWSPGDAINVFFGSNSQGRFVSKNGVPAAVADFSGTLNVFTGVTEGSTAPVTYWAVYPYDESNTCDGNSVTLKVPSVQSSQASTFLDGMFPSVARSDTQLLPFYNVCGGLCFTVSRNDIESIDFRANGGEHLAGKARVSFGSSGVPVAEALDGSSSITLTPAGSATFKAGEKYYFTILPVTLTSGFTITFHTSGYKEGTLSVPSPVTVKRSVFGLIEDMDSSVAQWTDDDATSAAAGSGLYLGITGFNQALYSYPLAKMTSSNMDGYTSFVSDLTSKNGTILYYAVEQSIDALKRITYPADLANVAIVTFTDGLDQGSMMMNPSFVDDDSYLDAINQRLHDEKIGGQPITAYSIGLRGSDVSDVAKFRTNLKKLASSDGNAFEVSSMSEVKSRFEQIAQVAKATTTITYTYNISFTVPGQATGTKIRFTFDNVSDAAASSRYIEGTFNLADRSLADVTYRGFTCSSGSTVSGIVDGIFVTFMLEDLVASDGVQVNPDNIRQWSCAPGSSSWQVNSEFDKDTDMNVKVDVDVTRKSAAVMLVLDCSSSLGFQFGTMQSNANSFIRTLHEASRDEYSVESVSLDRNTLRLRVGRMSILTASVSPSTAIDSKLRWTSSNTAVATVGGNGSVTAVAVGTCTISAVSSNGEKAECEVAVWEPTPEMAVDLGLSVKWAAFNIGATRPEEYGSYYQWAGTQDVTDRGIYLDYNNCPYHVTTNNKYASGWTKYIPSDKSSYWSGSGSPDNKTVLYPEDDIARVEWGGAWRMPTYEEMTELRENCSWAWTGNYNGTGVAGRIFTSKKSGYTDKSIFLPAAGFRSYGGRDDAGSAGHYWSSPLDPSSPYRACYLLLNSSNVSVTVGSRFHGLPVRPVCDIEVESFSLNTSALNIYTDKSAQLTATVAPSSLTNEHRDSVF